jgi:hypothetical protein
MENDDDPDDHNDGVVGCVHVQCRNTSYIYTLRSSKAVRAREAVDLDRAINNIPNVA